MFKICTTGLKYAPLYNYIYIKYRLSSCIWNLRFFPNDAQENCPFVLTSFTGWSSGGSEHPVTGRVSRGSRITW